MLGATRAHSWSKLKGPKTTREGGEGVTVRRGVRKGTPHYSTETKTTQSHTKETAKGTEG